MSETASMYYVRSRGRVSGPFDLAGLQKMVRRGLISRIHDISPDRVQWTSAGEFEDLFPSRQTPAATAVAAAGPGPETNSEAIPNYEQRFEPGGIAAGGTNEPRFYYSQAGSVVGPVPLAVLRTLAENGTLQADDPVWKEFDSVAVAARQLTHLTQVFGRPGVSRHLRRTLSSAVPQAMDDARSKTRITSLVTGLLSGTLILLFVNLPLITTPKVIFWWHAFQQGDSLGFAISCLLLTLIAVALLIVTPLTSGIARGIVFMAVAAAALLYWLISGIAVQAFASGGILTFALVLLPVLAALMISVGRYRAIAPERGDGRALSGVFATGLTICSVAGGITLLVAAGNDSGPTPGWASAIVICIVLQILLSLAAGITGLVQLKPSFTTGLNWAMMICAMAAMGVTAIWQAIVVVVLVDVGGLADALADSFGSGFGGSSVAVSVALLFFRLIAIYYLLITLLTSGLMETLLSNEARYRNQGAHGDD